MAPSTHTNSFGNGISVMLILSRRESECIHLGDDIIVTIVRLNGDKVRIGVQAPSHIRILRNELEPKWQEPTPVQEQSPVRRAA